MRRRALDAARASPRGGRTAERASSRSSATPARARARSSASAGQVDPNERAKFERDAALWWNETRGPFAALHAMNPTRVAFVRDAMREQFKETLGTNAMRDALRGTRVLDVGCGGGIFAESLARLGADVTAIDAGLANIEIARAHAARDPGLDGRLRYEHVAAEALGDRGETFDAVTSLEVIEHVSDPMGFAKSLGKLVRPGGALFLSTINRTARSFAFAIVGAERALGLVPPGTHSFSKFLTPGEVALLASRSGCEMRELAGMVYDPIRNTWALSTDVQINFIAHCVKAKESTKKSKD
ncbi:Ubiquinone biosynthesis O-methyltransferase [Ostreococcus tauri]|uniref:Ubiquinone biosynthesis O-methyltransferase, mitochondrial n=1 Tax=Ostreococcus tauri TaxID=70448 RepID=A0A090M437_OSTTA|nr:Ubiquinone biosynthesis O-methyltransferase [Ostreococcus tauri]CEF98961.1 Ubiquinone biosynthesis O-methyltransferase [Ostreococcus tauri]|eukprot:XP_022839567.1 Ubiquinone biosynthesis O-methyltransferase [Ostreococcus tauri]